MYHRTDLYTAYCFIGFSCAIWIWISSAIKRFIIRVGGGNINFINGCLLSREIDFNISEFLSNALNPNLILLFISGSCCVYYLPSPVTYIQESFLLLRVLLISLFALRFRWTSSMILRPANLFTGFSPCINFYNYFQSIFKPSCPSLNRSWTPELLPIILIIKILTHMCFLTYFWVFIRLMGHSSCLPKAFSATLRWVNFLAEADVLLFL